MCFILFAVTNSSDKRLAASLFPSISKTPGLICNSEDSVPDLCYAEAGHTAVFAESFIPFTTEPLISTSFDLLTILYLRM